MKPIKAREFQVTEADYTVDGECWRWKWAKQGRGYAYARIDGRNQLVHRWQIRDQLTAELNYALHTCRNRDCINPAHLYAGTQSQNMKDRLADGTDLRGDKSVQSKLTWAAADEIRAVLHWNGERYERTYYGQWRDLAMQYGVSTAAIRAVASGRTWNRT